MKVMHIWPTCWSPDQICRKLFDHGKWFPFQLQVKIKTRGRLQNTILKKRFEGQCSQCCMKSWTFLSRAVTDISCAVSPTKAIQVGQMLNWELANKISPWKSCSCQLVKNDQWWRHDHHFTQNIILQTQRRFSLSREYDLNDGAKLKLCLFAHRQPVKGG